MQGFFNNYYYLISLGVIILAMVPFVVSFEGRKPQAREIVLIAVLIAIAVVSRAAFFMVPQFKPIAAFVIIAGVCLGPQSGFMVGALSAFVSNFLFGQGPWTPWQMFALGVIGALAGVFFARRAADRRRLALLCLYGGVSVLVLYGLLADTASAMIFTATLNLPALLAVYAAGLPFNAIFAGSTVLFLLLLARPMIEKLERVKKKYGLLIT